MALSSSIRSNFILLSHPRSQNTVNVVPFPLLAKHSWYHVFTICTQEQPFIFDLRHTCTTISAFSWVHTHSFFQALCHAALHWFRNYHRSIFHFHWKMLLSTQMKQTFVPFWLLLSLEHPYLQCLENITRLVQNNIKSRSISQSLCMVSYMAE